MYTPKQEIHTIAISHTYMESSIQTYIHIYICICIYLCMYIDLENYRLGSMVDELWSHETYLYIGI